MATAHPVLIEPDVETVMPDGIVLRSTVYRPAIDDTRFPVLLCRTPYGRDLSVNSAYFNPTVVAGTGYVVIIQDCRGRFGSDGEFLPSIHEESDGEQTVKWAAELPYSNGMVGMFGRSYFSETQWRAARSGVENLASLALGVSAGSNANNGALYRGGAFELGSRFVWGHGSASVNSLQREHAADPLALKREMARWEELDRRFADGSVVDTLPLASLAPQLNSFMNTHILPSAGTGPDNEFCRIWDSAAERAVRLPTLHIGGWFDIFCPNTVDQYHRQLDAVGDDPRLCPRLIIGPWSHTNFSGNYPDVSFGMTAGSAAVGPYGDLSSLHTAFFDATLKDVNRRLKDVPQVLLYVMGENRWRAFDRWPQAERSVELYLGPDGSLSEHPEETGQRDYLYDPADPVPTVGGATMLPGALMAGPARQEVVEARDDVLVFTSEPLTEPLTVCGEVTAQLFAASSAVDTDFVVRLCAVTAAGESIGIADGIVRGSWRDACAGDGKFTPGIDPKPMNPGEVYELSICLWSTAYTFAAGERIRVQVTSSCHPRWDRNLNTGGSVYDSQEMVVARQQIFTGGQTASRIVLPFITV